MLCAIEDIVGGDLNHPAASLPDGMRQIARCLCIEQRAKLFVGFGLVDGCVSGTVHDAVNIVGSKKLFDGFHVGDIEFSHIGIEIVVGSIFFLEQLHFVAQLTVATSNQDVHLMLLIDHV